MSISPSDVEDAVTKYIFDNGRKPRFVLLDEKSYEEYSSCFTPRERVKTEVGITHKPQSKGISKIHLTKVELEVLPVKSDKQLFEVVA